MIDYISRWDAICAMHELMHEKPTYYELPLYDAIAAIHAIPAADVRPVVEQKTRADRIRSMSDEELARWIMYENPCGGIPEEKCHHYNGDEACIRCFCDWLREEADGEHV